MAVHKCEKMFSFFPAGTANSMHFSKPVYSKKMNRAGTRMKESNRTRSLIRRWVPLVFAMTSGFAISTSVRASNDNLPLLQVLLNNKLITQAQFDALANAAPTPAPAQVAPLADQDVLDVLLANGLISREQFAALRLKLGQERVVMQEAKLSLKDGFKVQSQDKAFSAQISAYAQLDAAAVGDDETDLSSGTELRRARLAVSGTLLTDWDYKLEAELAGTTQGGNTNTVTVTDAFVRWNGYRPTAVTVGNFKVPFGLEAVGSAKYQTFMERASPFAFINLRRLGGMLSTNGDNWTASAGLFGDTVTSQNGDDEGHEAAGRFTFAPWFASDRALHLGLSLGWVVPQMTALGGAETIAFRAKPESNLVSDGLTASTALNSRRRTFGRSSGRLVDTGNIPGNVNDYLLGAAEFATVYGPFSLQGEYTHARVYRDRFGDLDFNGYYVYGSWFLTGESRNYRGDKGAFDILIPRNNFSPKYGGWGAWEVATRYSTIDLTDGTVVGGTMDNVTFGLNWYPNSYIRVMANYVSVLEVEGGAHDGDNPDLVELRVQLAY